MKIALPRSLLLLLVITTGLLFTARVSAATVSVVNAGFNDLTGWTVSNDAVLAHPGGVAPWSWNTPVVATTIVRSSEEILPREGLGLGLTYAGRDSFSQFVSIPLSGTYTMSLHANAIAGIAYMDNPLLDGIFEFFAGSVSSSPMPVSTSDGWIKYNWTTTLTAGMLDIGFRNTLIDEYAIAYDDYRIDLVQVSAIPVPAAFWLFVTAMAGLIGIVKARR